jgi:Tol biopolymer transport system component
MARSGGQAQLLLPELEQVIQLYPRWSPRDAERVAYVAESAGLVDLWLADLASGRRERLTAGEMAALESPRWSPDGTRLAFSALPRDRPPEQANYDIYALDLSTGERRQITENAGDNFDPAWSPDGTSLLVSSTREIRDAPAALSADLWRTWLDGERAPERLLGGARGASTLEADWYGFADCDSSGR